MVRKCKLEITVVNSSSWCTEETWSILLTIAVMTSVFSVAPAFGIYFYYAIAARFSVVVMLLNNIRATDISFSFALCK